MNITVTHTLHPEVLEVLKSFVQSVPGKTAKSSGNNLQSVKDAPVEVKESKAETSASDPKKDTPVVSIEQIRAAVQKQSAAGKRDEIKKLLSEFGADKVTNLAKEQYPDFLAKLERA